MTDRCVCWCIAPFCLRIRPSANSPWVIDPWLRSQVVKGTVKSYFGYCDEHHPKAAKCR